jgi:colanic acid/amylovoran biosynthesis glycosyltransferase
MGFAYLFERFPSFSQTFCFREVVEMRRQAGGAEVFSIRAPDGEPRQDFPAGLVETTCYLPASFDAHLAEGRFRKRARLWISRMERLWGDDGEKRRIYEALWLADAARERGIRHIHAHFAGMAARTAFWLNRIAGVPYSFTAHANDVFCDEPKERLAMLVREAAFVASETDYSVRFLQKLYPECASKIHRVHNGIYLDRFAPAERMAGKPLVLSVGRYIEKKGFGDLIEACAEIRGIDFECRIVGQGPLEAALRGQAERAGLGGRVDLTGPKSESEVAGLLAKASVFVLPCVATVDGGSDNLPTVIMEAMAAGVPVISTPVAGVPEMVVDGETGWLVPEHDPQALRERIEAALHNPAKALAMGVAGRKRCAERFDIARTTGALRRLLGEAGAFEAGRRAWWRGWR